MILIEKPVIQFYPKSHRYKVNGRWCPNVTTILNVIDKPYLIPWYVKKSVEYIEANIGLLSSPHTTNELAKQILAAAKNKGDEEKDQAAKDGRLAHEEIERLVKGEILPEQSNERVRHITDKFWKWWTDARGRLIHSEVRLVSLSQWFVGTTDLICEIYGRREVVDFKSGKHINVKTMGKQLAAYRLAYEEMNPHLPPVEGMSILRIGFIDNVIEHESKAFEDFEFFKAGFLSTLGTYRWEQACQKLIYQLEASVNQNEEEVADEAI